MQTERSKGYETPCPHWCSQSGCGVLSGSSMLIIRSIWSKTMLRNITMSSYHYFTLSNTTYSLGMHDHADVYMYSATSILTASHLLKSIHVLFIHQCLTPIMQWDCDKLFACDLCLISPWWHTSLYHCSFIVTVFCMDGYIRVRKWEFCIKWCYCKTIMPIVEWAGHSWCCTTNQWASWHLSDLAIYVKLAIWPIWPLHQYHQGLTDVLEITLAVDWPFWLNLPRNGTAAKLCC